MGLDQYSSVERKYYGIVAKIETGRSSFDYGIKFEDDCAPDWDLYDQKDVLWPIQHC